MKRVFIVVFFIIVLIGVGFGVYVYKLHALGVEGNELYGLRCTDVNPSLIAYKNTFLGIAEQLNKGENADGDLVGRLYDEYNSGIDAYVVKEDEWSVQNNAYINRWDFQFFQPWFMKEAAYLQAQMYQGYRDDAYYLGQIVTQSGISDELEAQIQDARERRNRYSQEYSDFLDQIALSKDWRIKILNQPQPAECTAENTTIPDTTGSINW